MSLPASCHLSLFPYVLRPLRISSRNPLATAARRPHLAVRRTIHAWAQSSRFLARLSPRPSWWSCSRAGFLQPPLSRHAAIPPASAAATVAAEEQLDTGSTSDDPDKIPDLRRFPPERIRNFSIVAHVDHGKSTLADRLLEMAGNIRAGTHDHQVMDRLEVERERGITVKAQTATLFYTFQGQEYLLNLIDTPGHVDFSYEVQRSLTASQGVVLLVDANQGVQAQTLANFYAAFEGDLKIIPVLNKIDLKTADPDAVTEQMNKAMDIDPQEVLRVSAKTGFGVAELFQAIIQRVPPPKGSATGAFRAVLFDSWYDKYRGVVALIAVQDGELKRGDQITFLSSDKTYEVRDVGIMRPDRVSTSFLLAGQVGYITCNMKTTKEAQIGDTLFGKERPAQEGSRIPRAKPMVYAGIFPEDQSDNEALRDALDRLILNDSSVSVSLEQNAALGQGWRLGFLGLLHMEVFLQRLEYEHGKCCIATIPSVPYKARLKSNLNEKTAKEYGTDVLTIVSPEQLPAQGVVEEFQEPWVISTIITPAKYIGDILAMCLERRGQQKNVTFLDQTRAMMQFYLPLSEVIVDFFDELKSKTSGYASFDYEDADYRPVNLIKVDFLLNGKEVNELSMLVPGERARYLARRVCERLKDAVPQQQFPVSIQAAIGSKIVAREDLKALRKDVVGLKIYSHGGRDKGRKQKLLQRQKEGKERMRMIGNIQIPRDCFIKVLRKS
ncbi:translation factor Guf1, mitochondrial-like [Paramacrobiotus metropolitanus]|uniref:translation factor Guf1, mitochondrial-like n=1 Tax=Paramacrobiotus metropolitanus TaxID=2943436 RepID=UPI00244649C9|nr:translation factor Guf1, mitochondrial-like [Paramacrobiotus metropolitanus]